MAAHPGLGGLDADESVDRGRQPDRAAGIRAEGAEDEAGRYRGPRPARRAARDVGGVPRIAGRPVVRVVPGRAVRELGEVERADVECAGCVEPRKDGGGAIRHEVAPDLRAAGAHHPRPVEHVLVGEGDPVQRPRLVSGREGPVRRVGLGQRLVRIEAEEAVERAGVAFDPLYAGGGDLAGGELAGADPLRRVAERELGRRGHDAPPSDPSPAPGASRRIAVTVSDGSASKRGRSAKTSRVLFVLARRLTTRSVSPSSNSVSWVARTNSARGRGAHLGRIVHSRLVFAAALWPSISHRTRTRARRPSQGQLQRPPGTGASPPRHAVRPPGRNQPQRSCHRRPAPDAGGAGHRRMTAAGADWRPRQEIGETSAPDLHGAREAVGMRVADFG